MSKHGSSSPGNSEYQSKTKKTKYNASAPKPSYIALHTYKEWTNDEVIQVFSSPTSYGGADADEELLKELKEISFTGNDLHNLIGKKIIIDRVVKKFIETRIIGNNYWDLDSNQLIALLISKDVIEQVDELPTEFNSEYLINMINYLLSNGNEKLQKSIEKLNQEVFKKIEKFIYNYCCVNVSKKILDPEEARLKQSTQLISSSDVMPFLGIDTIYEKVITLLSSRFNHNKLGNDKFNHPIIFITGATGTGKSRTAFEYLSSVKQKIPTIPQLVPYLENKIELFLRINYNGIKFGTFTKIDPKSNEGEDNFEKFIVVRLFYTFLSSFSFKALKKEELIDKAEILTQEHPTVTKCLQYIKSLFYKSDKALIHIVIDEFQLLDNYHFKKTCGDTRSYLNQLCNCLGEASCLLSKNETLLINTLAGTHYSLLSDIINQSTHPFVSIDTTRPTISIVDIFYFINEFITKFPGEANVLNLTSNYFNNENLLRCINLCFTVPRKVECLITSLKVCTDWNQVETSINNYSLSQVLPERFRSIAELIYAYSILQIPVTRDFQINTITIAALEESAVVVLIPHPTILHNYLIHLRLSGLVLLGGNNSNFKIFNHKLEEVIKNGGATKCKGIDLELLNAYYEIVLNECYLKIGRSEVLFSERFRGMLPSKKVMDSVWNSTIKLRNTAYSSISQNDSISDKYSLYHYQKTTNKEGCDRLGYLIVKQNNQDKEYTLQYQDRGIDSASATEKNREGGNIVKVSSSDVDKELKKNTASDGILVYCSLKSYSAQLVSDLLLETQKKYKLYEQNCLVLGNASASAIQQFEKQWPQKPVPPIGLEYYYGNQIYDLLFQTSLPKILHVSELSMFNRKVLSFAFGTQVDSEIEELIKMMKLSKSLEMFETFVKNSKMVKFVSIIRTRFTTDKSDSSKIVLVFSEQESEESEGADNNER